MWFAAQVTTGQELWIKKVIEDRGLKAAVLSMLSGRITGQMLAHLCPDMFSSRRTAWIPLFIILFGRFPGVSVCFDGNPGRTNFQSFGIDRDLRGNY
jgi:hypothetical protein